MYYLICGLLSLSSTFFFFKQKTAYEMRISDWSSDVCSSDLLGRIFPTVAVQIVQRRPIWLAPQPHAGLLRRTAAFAAIARGTGRHEVIEIGRASCRERVCQYV